MPGSDALLPPEWTTESSISPTMLIVTGPMRSGTTLVGELLYSRSGEQRHPDIVFDNDRSNIIRKLAEIYRQTSRDRECEWHIEDPFRAFLPKIEPLRALLKLGNPDRRFQDAGETMGVQQVKAHAARMIQSEVLKNVSCNAVPQVVGFKTTHLMREPELVRPLFTNVRTVFLARDPRDIVASNLERTGRQHGSAG